MNMVQRRSADRGLMDAWMDGLGGPRTTAMLDRLDAAVAWAALAARGVTSAIMFKRKRGQAKLPPLLAQLNRLIASVRAVVEHLIAWMKNMVYRKVRYRGRRRNELDFAFNLIACNWKRSLSLAGGR